MFDQTYGPWACNFIKVDSNKMSSSEIFDILPAESQSFGKFVSTGITLFSFLSNLRIWIVFYFQVWEKMNYNLCYEKIMSRNSCCYTQHVFSWSRSFINYLRRCREWEGVGKDLLYIIPNLPNMLLPISNGTSRKGVIILGWWRVGTSSHLHYVFLIAVWLPHGELWAIIERIASLTPCW